MQNIFLGFLFEMLDFNLDIGASTIGLIPDFIGFWLLNKGMSELSTESDIFSRKSGLALILMACSLVIYVIDLLGLSLGLLGPIIGIAMTIAKFYLEYQVLIGMFELEEYNHTHLGADDCKTKWIFVMVMNLLNIVLIWIPFINIVCLIIAFIMGIVFLVSVNTFKNNYLEVKNSQYN